MALTVIVMAVALLTASFAGGMRAHDWAALGQYPFPRLIGVVVGMAILVLLPILAIEAGAYLAGVRWAWSRFRESLSYQRIAGSMGLQVPDRMQAHQALGEMVRTAGCDYPAAEVLVRFVQQLSPIPLMATHFGVPHGSRPGVPWPAWEMFGNHIPARATSIYLPMEVNSAFNQLRGLDKYKCAVGNFLVWREYNVACFHKAWGVGEAQETGLPEATGGTIPEVFLVSFTPLVRPAYAARVRFGLAQIAADDGRQVTVPVWQLSPTYLFRSP